MQNQYPMTRSKPISQRGLLGVIHLLVPCFLFSNPITYYHLLPPMFYDFTGKTTCESYTQLQLSRLFLDHETLKSKTFMYSNVMRWSCLKTSSPHPVKLRTCVTRLLKFNTKAPTCSFHFGGLGWFLSNRNTMGWNDKKVKLRSELVVELLDVAGVVVLGRRVKCRELQEIYELNKMSWLACFNVGDQGRTPSRDHLIWKSLGVSKVLTCAPRKMQHFQTHSFFPTCRTNLAYAIRSISFNQTKIHPNCGQPCWKTTGSCCPIRWFSPSAKPLSPPCLDARSCKHFLLMPSGFPFQKDIIWSEMKQVFPGFLWGKGSADVRTISSNMIFVLTHVDVSWELMVLGDW